VEPQPEYRTNDCGLVDGEVRTGVALDTADHRLAQAGRTRDLALPDTRCEPRVPDLGRKGGPRVLAEASPSTLGWISRWHATEDGRGRLASP
jgi:hypothetical protein